ADARQWLEHLTVGAPLVGARAACGPHHTAPTRGAPTAEGLGLRSLLDKLFSKQSIKDLEHGQPLKREQLAFLQSLVEAASPPRPVILAELARKDPSLSVLVSGLYPAQIAAPGGEKLA